MQPRKDMAEMLATSSVAVILTRRSLLVEVAAEVVGKPMVIPLLTRFDGVVILCSGEDVGLSNRV